MTPRHAHTAQFRVVGDQTLQQLGLAHLRLVHSIRADQPAHAAFSLIRKHVSALVESISSVAGGGSPVLFRSQSHCPFFP